MKSRVVEIPFRTENVELQITAPEFTKFLRVVMFGGTPHLVTQQSEEYPAREWTFFLLRNTQELFCSAAVYLDSYFLYSEYTHVFYIP